MEIYIGGRCSGKTTQCVKYIISHSDVHLITTPSNKTIVNQKIVELMSNNKYNEVKQVLNRVHTISTFYGYSTRTKIIFDDFDYISDKITIPLVLTSNVIAIFTSIGDSYDNSGTFLRKLIKVYGCKKLKPLAPFWTTKTILNYKKSVPADIFFRDFLGNYLEGTELDRKSVV
jgi:hypothetical protein